METNTRSFEMKQPTLLSRGLSALEARTVQSLLPGLSEVVPRLSDVHSTEKQVFCSPTENSPRLSASKSRTVRRSPYRKHTKPRQFWTRLKKCTADCPRSGCGLSAVQKSTTLERSQKLLRRPRTVRGWTPHCPLVKTKIHTEKLGSGLGEPRLLDCPPTRRGLSMNHADRRTEHPKNRLLTSIHKFAANFTNCHETW
jgi:hypothetical protein